MLEQAGRAGEGRGRSRCPWSSQLWWSHHDSMMTILMVMIPLPRIQDLDLLEDFWVSRQFSAFDPSPMDHILLWCWRLLLSPAAAGALSSCWAGFFLLNCLVYSLLYLEQSFHSCQGWASATISNWPSISELFLVLGPLFPPCAHISKAFAGIPRLNWTSQQETPGTERWSQSKFS